MKEPMPVQKRKYFFTYLVRYFILNQIFIEIRLFNFGNSGRFILVVPIHKRAQKIQIGFKNNDFDCRIKFVNSVRNVSDGNNVWCVKNQTQMSMKSYRFDLEGRGIKWLDVQYLQLCSPFEFLYTRYVPIVLVVI